MQNSKPRESGAFLFTALAGTTVIAMQAGTFHWPALQHYRGTHEVHVSLGLVTRVQGFKWRTATYAVGIEIALVVVFAVAAEG